MQVSINNETFTIEEFAGGWGWVTDNDESMQDYPEPYQALQDAMNYVHCKRLYEVEQKIAFGREWDHE